MNIKDYEYLQSLKPRSFSCKMGSTTNKRELTSIANKGKTMSEEARLKMSISKKGKSHSDERKILISKTSGHAKKVRTPKGVFSSIINASIAYKKSNNTISDWLKKEKNGFSFID